MTTKREIVERIIEEEGFEELLRNPPSFLKENYGNEEEKEIAAEEEGYDIKDVVVFTLPELLDYYEETVKEQLLNKDLIYYIDIPRMIYDEWMGGYIDYTVLDNGHVYFFLIS